MPASVRVLPQSQAGTVWRRKGKQQTVGGYAARFFDSTEQGTEYHLWDGVYERLRPSAFDRAIREKHDTRCLFNHNPDLLLARTANGTCRLRTDRLGLWYEFDVDPGDPDHSRVVAKMARGDLSGSSFAFQPLEVEWENLPDGRTVRWISDLRLVDVSVVTYPAYASSTAGIRHDKDQIETVQAELKEWQALKHKWRVRWLRLAKLQSDIDLSGIKSDESTRRRRKLAAVASK